MGERGVPRSTCEFKRSATYLAMMQKLHALSLPLMLNCFMRAIIFQRDDLFVFLINSHQQKTDHFVGLFVFIKSQKLIFSIILSFLSIVLEQISRERHFKTQSFTPPSICAIFSTFEKAFGEFVGKKSLQLYLILLHTLSLAFRAYTISNKIVS